MQLDQVNYLLRSRLTNMIYLLVSFCDARLLFIQMTWREMDDRFNLLTAWRWKTVWFWNIKWVNIPFGSRGVHDLVRIVWAPAQGFVLPWGVKAAGYCQGPFGVGETQWNTVPVDKQYNSLTFTIKIAGKGKGACHGLWSLVIAMAQWEHFNQNRQLTLLRFS